MTKRAPGRPRMLKDFYPTPHKAMLPLFPHLAGEGERFIEPCCGNDDMVNHLVDEGYICVGKSDLIFGEDAFQLTNVALADFIITNPPWERKTMHSLIDHLVSLGKPLWLLLEADWMHTKQAAPHLRWCSKIISVGRVRWMPDTKMDGFDNAAWYRFHQGHNGATEFVCRTA